MLDALEGAKLEHGVAVSLKNIAYYVTGTGILSDRGKRWSSQTISDKINIADIQQRSITGAWRRIQALYDSDGVIPNKELMTWWRKTLAEEVSEVEELQRNIDARLSRPPSNRSWPTF
ncbi:hypothetical protein SR41_11030 [Sphingomonas melonis]|uniref:Uncharacterized protein n=1 Tax=Sphingomonas melonis TaxID=152682 RepID=A0A0D1K130_9SPHN|nr:hypothetical protein [Sphingomonas melonis]KIU27218.1 hypothetical protein SR41_11030 [Sphingomonas melonis]